MATTLKRTYSNQSNGNTFSIDIPQGVNILSARARYRGGNALGSERHDLEGKGSSYPRSISGIPNDFLTLPTGETFHSLRVHANGGTEYNSGDYGNFLNAGSVTVDYPNSTYFSTSFTGTVDRSSSTLSTTLKRGSTQIGYDSITHEDGIGAVNYYVIDLEFTLFWILELRSPSLKVNGTTTAQGTTSEINYLAWDTYRNIDAQSLVTGTNNFTFNSTQGKADTIEVEIVYELPKPTLISPNGGESLNELHTLSVQPNQVIRPLKYEFQLSTNNGSSWYSITETAYTSQTSVLTHGYNFANEPATSLAKIRVRSTDGTIYSDWDESNGIFTIQHNIAPSTPTSLAPNGSIVDRLITQRLSWKHNDSPNDIQSKAQIQWRSQGASLWFQVESNGPNQEYFFPPNTFPNGQIEWSVRTYDAAGLASPWSNVAVFSAAEPTSAPTIIQPTTTVSVARPIIEWTSASQASYQLVVEDSLNAVVWDTGELTSTVKARTLGVDLLNGGTYKVKVRVKDGSGLFSSFAERAFNVSYTPPALPVVDAYKNESAIQLALTNPVPTGTQPAVIENEIYKYIDSQWVRIATGILSTFTDYTLASEEQAQYRVRALGDNGTFIESDVILMTGAKLTGIWLHDVHDPETTIHQFKYNENRSENYQTEHTFQKFAGRAKRTIEFGIYEEYDVSVMIQLLNSETARERLVEYARNRATLLYRDTRGRKFYTTIPTLSMEDVFYGNVASITFSDIDYNEEV